jgi:hypothetical protein
MGHVMATLKEIAIRTYNNLKYGFDGRNTPFQLSGSRFKAVEFCHNEKVITRNVLDHNYKELIGNIRELNAKRLEP